MTLYKVVSRKGKSERIALTESEEAELRAEWAKNEKENQKRLDEKLSKERDQERVKQKFVATLCELLPEEKKQAVCDFVEYF